MMNPRLHSPRAAARARLALLVCILSALLGARGALARADFPLIGLNVDPAIVSENAGARAAVGTVRRDGSDNSRSLTVRLSSALAGLAVPESVQIPSGAQSVQFPIGVADDSELNGTRIALITASASGFYDTYFALTVTDDESLFEMTVAPETIVENGGRATITLRRAASTSGVSEEILLSASLANALRLPDKARFEAGQSEVSFVAEAIDNDAFDGPRTVSVTAQRPRSGQVLVRDLSLLDNELNLTISAPATMPEGAGTAFFATISRTSASAAQGDAVVSVASGDASEVIGAAGVLMRAGQTSVAVPLQVVDDGLVDGPQVLALTASAAGYSGGTQQVTVTDNDRAALQLSLNAAAVGEAAVPSRVFGTLRRNTSIESALTVSLRSSLPTRIALPASVVIPVGAAEARFPIRVLDSAARDGSANAGIVASAPGFASATASLGVLDNDGPALEVSFANSEGPEGLVEKIPAGVGRVTRRNLPLNVALAVTLTSSDVSVATLELASDAGEGVGAGSNKLQLVIPAGRQFAEFLVKTPDNADPSDIRSATISASAAGASGGAAPFDVADNDDAATLRVTVRALAPSAETQAQKEPDDPNFCGPAVDEGAGPRSVAVTVRRNTAATSDLIVQISASGPLSVPSTIVIPFGLSQVTFFATPQDDGLRCNEDTDAIASVSASVAGYASADGTLGTDGPGTNPPAGSGGACDTAASTSQILIVDDESFEGCVVIRKIKLTITPRVARDPRAISEADAPQAGTVQVKRSDSETDEKLPLVVDLSSNLPERAYASSGSSPASDTKIARVIVPAYSASDLVYDKEDKTYYSKLVASVPLLAVRDKERDPCASLTITATVVGFLINGAIVPPDQVGGRNPYNSSGDTVGLLDEQSALDSSSLSVSPRVVQESGASGVATGLLRRPAGLVGALTVHLRSLSPQKVGVSPSDRRSPTARLDVTLPADRNEVSFNVIAIDNALADGNVVAFIEATTDCSSASDRLPITIVDNDAPSLSLSITTTSPGGLSEGMDASTIVARVSRNTKDLSKPLDVTLRSSDASELVISSKVRIPAGQASALFRVRIVDDAVADGPQRVVVQAVAAGLRAAQATLVVGDNEAPK